MLDDPPVDDVAAHPPSNGGVVHPHDRYFRAALQGRAEQAALVSTLFPGLAAMLDADGFESDDGSYVDEELRQQQSDVLLRARLRGCDVLVYVLVEHQSTVDPLMPLRMMRYQERIWTRYLARHPGRTKLPAILPAVIYQGDRAWTAATDLRDMLDVDSAAADAVADYLPRLRYRLDDLTRIDVDALRGRTLTAPLRLMLLLLTQAPVTPHLPELLESLLDDLATVASGDNGPAHLQAAFTYIVSVADVPPGTFGPIANRLGPVALEAFMTTADVFRFEGRAEGRTETEVTLLLRLLAAKFGPLDEATEARVRAATNSQRESWILAVLDATSLDEVLNRG